jgi:phosphate starvation-inducible protein PhoH and related proteins
VASEHRAPDAVPSPAPLVVDFDDNRLLSALFGEHDRNLARIEQRLGVSLISRGNRVAIKGQPAAARAAKLTLEVLYRRLKGGLEVGAGDVDGAIRMAEAGEEDAPPAPRGHGPALSEHLIRTQKRLISPRSPGQRAYVRALLESELVFGLGPAGTGKTYLAVAVAVAMLLEGRVDRLILTRPAVEAGERLGFLPGTMDEKVDPYMRPMYDALYDMLPGEKVMKRRVEGDIEVAPLAFMRGRTLANSFIILDEAQNATPVQMKMFLTRMGENSRMAVTGDPSQVDLPTGARSGLLDALSILEGTPGIRVVGFTPEDVVRHPMVTQIVQAYEARERAMRRETP